MASVSVGDSQEMEGEYKNVEKSHRDLAVQFREGMDNLKMYLVVKFRRSG